TEGYHAVVHANADRHGRLAIAPAFVVPLCHSFDQAEAAGDAATRIGRLQLAGTEQRHEPVTEMLVHDAVKALDDRFGASMEIVEESEGLVRAHPGGHGAVALDVDKQHGNRANAEIALLGRLRGAPWPAALAASIAGLLGLVAGPEEGDILDLRPARRADRSAIDSRRRHAVIEQPIEPRVTVQDGVPARFIAIEEVGKSSVEIGLSDHCHSMDEECRPRTPLAAGN